MSLISYIVDKNILIQHKSFRRYLKCDIKICLVIIFSVKMSGYSEIIFARGENKKTYSRYIYRVRQHNFLISKINKTRYS